MAKDDYHVIVYQILSYLYVQLKKGEPGNLECLSAENQYFCINESYWKFIMQSLVHDGLIKGIIVSERRYTGSMQTVIRVEGLEQARITPRGIEYLTDNALMRKAAAFFMESGKTIAPFVLETAGKSMMNP